MMLSKRLFLLVFLILSSISVTAQADYYADVKISVSNDGLVSFKGETNHPELTGESQAYTSKDGRKWLLNISLEEVFSDYIYELNLPENADVNYLKTPRLSRIEDKEGITIIGTGENNKFLIVVQYSINPATAKNPPYVVGILFITVAAFLFYKNKQKKKKPSYNRDALTERQKQIMNILEKAGKPITQAAIEKETRLPKSSLSRNIDSLVRKGIIQKESKGMSNIIFLKENEEKE